LICSHINAIYSKQVYLPAILKYFFCTHSKINGKGKGRGKEKGKGKRERRRNYTIFNTSYLTELYFSSVATSM